MKSTESSPKGLGLAGKVRRLLGGAIPLDPDAHQLGHLQEEIYPERGKGKGQHGQIRLTAARSAQGERATGEGVGHGAAVI